LCTTLSRTFTEQAESFVGATLVPLADLVNHETDFNVEYAYDSPTKMWVYKSLKDIPGNSYVSISYGHKENLELLHEYGFVPSHSDNCFTENCPHFYTQPYEFGYLLRPRNSPTLDASIMKILEPVMKYKFSGITNMMMMLLMSLLMMMITMVRRL
jgi:hypothetical protein